MPLSSSRSLAQLLWLLFVSGALATDTLAVERAAGQTQTDTANARLTIAVAANFRGAMQQLVASFTEHMAAGSSARPELTVVSGATGTLYAQITQGAPFDIFFAADSTRPKQLLASGHARAGSLTPYAHGILALAYRRAPGKEAMCDGQIDSHSEFQRLLDTLGRPVASGKTRIAMANPRIAPYGAAANEVLESLSVVDSDAAESANAESTKAENNNAKSDSSRPQLQRVLGRNVLQALQFLEMGHLELALVAYSLAPASQSHNIEFCPFAATMHAPIAQSRVVINRPRNREQELLLEDFLRFIESGQATQLVSAMGYR